jgi:hypothetical protein
MAVLADRLEHEHLRLDLGLQLDHQAHHARLVAPGADQLDVGIRLGNLVGQASAGRC